LNISIGTVSKALNGRHDVNEKTRKRVLAAAAKLGYAPNQSGRSLRQGSTNAVGFMIEFSEEAAANSDNFFMGLVEGAQSVLARHKLDLVVLPYSTQADSYEQLHRIVARRLVDALIISATQRTDPRIEFLSGSKIPFIALGRSRSGGAHPWIDLDFEGLANSDLVALKERPTAILLVYELLAMGLYRRLNEAGLVPGTDIAVIGFREGPQARFLSPTLTCFRMSLHDLGVTLGESLLAVLPTFQQVYPLGTVQKIWPLELVPGESDAFRLQSISRK